MEDNFKANIVKLDRAIVYQPLFLSDKLNDKILRNYKLTAQWNDVGLRRVAFGKDAELTSDSSFYMGCRDLKGSHPRINIKKFDTNEQRDKYYLELVKLIKESVKYLVEFNG